MSIDYKKRNQEIYSRYMSGGVTLAEIGADYGITRERVRQLCRSINPDFQNELEAKDLSEIARIRSLVRGRKRETGESSAEIVENLGIPLMGKFGVRAALKGFYLKGSRRERGGVVEKRCSGCMEWLPDSASDFSPRNKNGDLSSRCKRCGVENVRRFGRKPRSTATYISWTRNRVDPSGVFGASSPCWIINKAHRHVYGCALAYMHRGKLRKISTILFERKFNVKVPNGMYMAHVCCWGAGKYGCVNPDHLRVSTPQENADDQPDRLGTGRHVRGGVVIDRGIGGLEKLGEEAA